MRVLLMSILMVMGVSVSVFAEDAQTSVSECEELKETMIDLQVDLLEMEVRMQMEVYPSCSINSLVSPIANDYCGAEGNLRAITEIYRDKCENSLNF